MDVWRYLFRRYEESWQRLIPKHGEFFFLGDWGGYLEGIGMHSNGAGLHALYGILNDAVEEML